MSAILVTLLSAAILVVGFLVGWWVGGIGTTLSGVAVLALPVLIIGFLIGWLVEWILDNQYRRMQGQGTGTATASSVSQDDGVFVLGQTLKEVISEREREIGELRAELENRESQYGELEAELENRESRYGELEVELGNRESRYGELEAEFERYTGTHPDDLTAIKGIGRIYQWKLRDAGYATYAQLAKVDPDVLRKVLDMEEWQSTELQAWIDQAQLLLERPEEE